MQIPKPHVEVFERLASFDRTQWDSLLDVLRQTPPGFSYSTIAAGLLAQRLQGLTAVEASDLIRAIAALYLNYYRASTGIEEFSESFRSALSRRSSLTPEALGALSTALKRVLELDESLGVSAKGLALLYSEQRLFSECQVITDIRPVFGSDPEVAPPAAMIVHALRIQYHEAGAEHEVFVSLDTEDLHTLRKAADRALRKDQTLRSWLKHANWHDLGGEP